jgi:thymidylate synthase
MSKNIEHQYLKLLKDILDNGVEKQDRTGTGTLSVFGRQIRHDMSLGFPLLTTKKMYWKGIVTELLWFLRGDTNIKYLVDNDCHIWDGDAYKNWCRQFEVDPNNFDAEEVAKGHNDQCWGYPILDHVKPTSKEYKRGQINAYLEGKAEKPFFYLSQEEFINKIKIDDEFAKKWGELGPIYGKQWRSWKKSDSFIVEDDVWKNNEGWCSLEDFNKDELYIDQITNLINDLKTNPDSRRLMVTAWNPAELDKMTLPPCHYGFQVYTRELSLEERYNLIEEDKHTQFVNWQSLGTDRVKEVLDEKNIPTRAISLMFNMRSNDVPLGLPFNLASYGLLLQIIAKEVNMVPDELIASLGDAHIYVNQIDGVKEQLTREPYKLPTLVMVTNPELKFDEYVYDNFKLVNYQSHPTIKMPLSN